MNDKFVFNIIAEDKKGLLNQIIAIFNKRNFEIDHLNFSRIDEPKVVVITFEIKLPVEELHTTLHKIEKIIEVYRVFAVKCENLPLRKSSFFRVSKKLLNELGLEVLKKFRAEITYTGEDSIVIEKCGSDQEITDLYEVLKDNFLISYCKSALICEKVLVDFHRL
jgi:acetolactate synthase small subunit